MINIIGKISYNVLYKGYTYQNLEFYVTKNYDLLACNLLGLVNQQILSTIIITVTC